MQACLSRGIYLENDFFSRLWKSQGIFVDSQGNLERTWKVREKSELRVTPKFEEIQLTALK